MTYRYRYVNVSLHISSTSRVFTCICKTTNMRSHRENKRKRTTQPCELGLDLTYLQYIDYFRGLYGDQDRTDCNLHKRREVIEVPDKLSFQSFASHQVIINSLRTSLQVFLPVRFRFLVEEASSMSLLAPHS